MENQNSNLPGLDITRTELSQLAEQFVDAASQIETLKTNKDLIKDKLVSILVGLGKTSIKIQISTGEVKTLSLVTSETTSIRVS